MKDTSSKLIAVLLVIIGILVCISIWIFINKSSNNPSVQILVEDTVHEKDTTNIEWVKVVRNSYSFESPKTWINNELDVDGCIWDGISIPGDGHYLRGEIAIYPKSCVDITKLNHKEYSEKNGYYIIPIYGDNEIDIQITKLAYQKILETFQLVIKNTYTYKNHGFTIELPTGFIVKETPSEGGPAIFIPLPGNSHMTYVTNATFWEEHGISQYAYLRTEKIGTTMFKVYGYGATESPENYGVINYWFKQGNVGYQFSGDVELLKTFKFVGWGQ